MLKYMKKKNIYSRLLITALCGGVLSASAAVVPSDGLMFRFDAGSLDLADGAAVNSWANQGSLGGNMVVWDAPDGSTDYQAPDYVSSFAGFGGQPAVKFTRAGDESTAMSFGASGEFTFPESLDGLTIFAVLTVGEHSGRAFGHIGNVQGFGFGLEGGTNPGYRFAPGSALTSDALDGPVLLSYLFPGNELRVDESLLRVDGGDVDLDFAQGGNIIELTNEKTNMFVLGGRLNNDMDRTVSGSNDVVYNGYLAEILVYDRQLSAAEMEQVESYLINTYAIPEPSTYALLLGLAGLGIILLRRRRC